MQPLRVPHQAAEPPQPPRQLAVLPVELPADEQVRVRKDLGVEHARLLAAEEPHAVAEEVRERGKRRLGVGVQRLDVDAAGRPARGLENLGRGGGAEGVALRGAEDGAGGEVERREEGVVLGVEVEGVELGWSVIRVQFGILAEMGMERL